MITLRPHHMLCIKAFEGKGYNKGFIDNMDNIIKSLNKDDYVSLRIHIDSICRKCPSKLNNIHCETEHKVREMDRKVLQYLNIKEGIYIYDELKKLISKNIRYDEVVDICSKCQWFNETNCIDKLIKKQND